MHNITVLRIAFVARLSLVLCDCLIFVANDLNRNPVYPLIFFGLHGLYFIPARGKAVLHRLITNHPNLFHIRLQAPVSSTGHSCSSVWSTIYCHRGYHSFVRTRQIKAKTGKYSPDLKISVLDLLRFLWIPSLCAKPTHEQSQCNSRLMSFNQNCILQQSHSSYFPE